MKRFARSAIGGLTVIVGAVGAIACDGSVRNGPGTGGTNPGQDAMDPYDSPTATLAVEPGQQTTANDGASIRLDGSAPFGTPDTAWLATGVSLGVGPARDAVPFTGTLTSSSGGFAYTLAPTSPLSAGWYSVVLAPPSTGFVAQTASNEHPVELTQRPDGTYESRFRVGSSPLVLAVAACTSKGDGLLPKLVVTFSEPVEVGASPPVEMTIDGTVAHCSATDPNQNTQIGFSCSPSTPAAAAITVSFAEGIVAVAGGAPLHDATGAKTMAVELPPGTGPQTSCRTWRETRVSEL